MAIPQGPPKNPATLPSNPFIPNLATAGPAVGVGGLVVPPPRPPNVGPGIPNFLIRLPSGPYQPPLGPAVQPKAIAFEGNIVPS